MKKSVSLILALVLCFSLIPCAFAAETQSAADKFTDVPADAWYLDELEYAVYNGYISGTSATTFSPDGSLTRGQFVTILGRMLGVSTSSGKTKFTDVDEKSWYAPYVAWAADKGFVSGTSSTTFAPDALITFEQMGTILANYISKTGVELKGYTASEEYKDASSISGWAAANMEVMRQYGLLPTDAAGNVNPQRAVNRAEGTVSLVRLARATGLGVEPPASNSANTDGSETGERYLNQTEIFVNELHDSMWKSGEITESMSEKEKAIVYWEWMCRNCVYGTGTAYGLDANDAHTAYGALINKTAVCEGLSKAYYLLLASEGIKCICVPDFKHNHMWNEAYLDGAWYKIDMTDTCTWAKNPDGSYYEFGASLYRDKHFGAPIPGPSIPVD